MAKAAAEQNTEREMTLIGHLDELRKRLIISVGFFIVAVCVCFFFAMPVLQILIRPVTAIHEKRPIFKSETPSGVLRLEADTADGALRVTNPELLAAHDPKKPLVIELMTRDGATTRSFAVGGSGRISGNLIYTSPLDPFMMPLKVAVIMAILVSLPVWIWQIWLFIAPGLLEKEKKVVAPMLSSALILFPIGSALAYFMLFFVISFMQTYIVEGIETLYTIKDYLKLMTTMMIVFGFIFELPLVVAVMARVGFVTPAFLRQYRRHIYVGLAFVAMILTPADPFSMLIAFVPLIVLFEISIILAQVMARQRRAAEEAAAQEAA